MSLRFCYLIDPVERMVRPLRLRAAIGHLHDELLEIYAVLGCATIEEVRPVGAGNDIIFIDGAAVLPDMLERTRLACWSWRDDRLAGKALWTGIEDGEITTPNSPLEYVRAHVRFGNSPRRIARGRGCLPVNRPAANGRSSGAELLVFRPASRSSPR